MITCGYYVQTYRITRSVILGICQTASNQTTYILLLTLLRKLSPRNINVRKNFTIAKFMGNPTKRQISLEKIMSKASPSLDRPFKVLKQLADTTYRIQHLQGNRQCKVVNFDKMKPCTKAPAQHSTQQKTLPEHHHPTENKTRDTSQSATIGIQLELLVDDDDVELPLPHHQPHPMFYHPLSRDIPLKLITRQQCTMTILLTNWTRHLQRGG